MSNLIRGSHFNTSLSLWASLPPFVFLHSVYLLPISVSFSLTRTSRCCGHVSLFLSISGYFLSAVGLFQLISPSNPAHPYLLFSTRFFCPLLLLHLAYPYMNLDVFVGECECVKVSVTLHDWQTSIHTVNKYFLKTQHAAIFFYFRFFTKTAFKLYSTLYLQRYYISECEMSLLKSVLWIFLNWGHVQLPKTHFHMIDPILYSLM